MSDAPTRVGIPGIPELSRVIPGTKLLIARRGATTFRFQEPATQGRLVRGLSLPATRRVPDCVKWLGQHELLEQEVTALAGERCRPGQASCAS